jgi:c(7)-type cytochrome triheme protein
MARDDDQRRNDMRRMKAHATVLSGIVVLLIATAPAATPLAFAEEAKAKPGEATIIFDDLSHGEQGPVEFSHVAHRKAFGEEKPCARCHIKPKLFPMKRKPDEARLVITMKEMEQGKSCGACHDGKTTINGKTAFSVASKENCARCHKKK